MKTIRKILTHLSPTKTATMSPTTCIFPPSAPHTHTIIILHGRGSTASAFLHEFQQSLSSSGHTLPELFPSTRWVFPSSALRPLARFPGEIASQWFDTWDISRLELREELQIAGLRESVRSIREIVQREVELLGGRWERVVLAGVSQGGATAAHVLLNLNVAGERGGKRIGGLMTFCSRMPFPGRGLEETRAVLGLGLVPGGDDEVVRNTPVLGQHCVDDPLVRIGYGRQLREAFEQFGAEVTWKEYEMGGHWIKSPEGIDDAAKWLEDCVGLGRRKGG